MERGDTVDDAVGADLARVFVQDAEAGVGFVRSRTSARDRSTDATSRPSVESSGGTTLAIIMPSTLARLQFADREEIAEENAPLIGGLIVDGAERQCREERHPQKARQ